MKQFLPIISLLFLAALPALEAASDQKERLKGVIDGAIEAVYGDCCAERSIEEKQAKVRELLESEYEIDVIIRRAIGRNWRLMNETEQQKVLELTKQLVVKAYVKGLDGKARPEINFGETIQISDKRMEIPSTITLDGKTVNVLYRLGKMRSGWQIYDIVAEDISVVSNYRQQIDDHFRKGNAQELIDKLNELLAKEDINDEIKI